METELIMRLNIGSIISICTIASLLLQSVVSSGIPNTLIISFDGFRWDYIHKTNNIPNFNSVIHTGGWSVKGTKNAFLTTTLPNHYTLVTGLYEESHGLVGNVIYDPHLNETYRLENKTQECKSKWFDDGGEPIWVTNQRQSTQHRTGSVFWPGSCAPVKGFVPYRFLRFDRTVEFKKRVDIIVDWFNDEYPINLGLLYFEDPDQTGHIYGPDSPQIIKKIEELDNVLGYLFEKLQNIRLLENMNIIITSDHGMTSTPNDGHHQIDLNKYISRDSYDITSYRPVAAIRPKRKELESEIFKNLSNIPNLHVYRKEDIPDDYHFKHNDRIQPILAEPSEHYWISIDSNSTNPEGNHGYNNSLETMHPVFMAMGPAFRAGSKVSTFNAVDVYPLMCHILGLVPAPNNGSLDHVRHLLKLVDTSQGGTSTFTSFPRSTATPHIKDTGSDQKAVGLAVGLVLAIVFLVAIGIFAILMFRRMQNKRPTTSQTVALENPQYADSSKVSGLPGDTDTENAYNYVTLHEDRDDPTYSDLHRVGIFPG